MAICVLERAVSTDFREHLGVSYNYISVAEWIIFSYVSGVRGPLTLPWSRYLGLLSSCMYIQYEE